MKRILIGLALVVSAAIAQSATYGTQVNAAWYDRVAALYQNPPIESFSTTEALAIGATGFDNTAAKYPTQYPPLFYRAYVGPSADGKGGVVVTSNPSPTDARAQKLALVEGSTCVLLGEASLSERIIRNNVADLENVVNNAPLRDRIVALAQLDRLYVEYVDITFSRPDKVAAVVATVSGVRVPAEKILEVDLDVTTKQGYVQYTASYQAEFSLKRLIDAGAVQQNIVTFQHGWSKSDFCAFDLSKLP